MKFVPFPKIARLSRPVIVTEKIDGTNALVHIVTLAEVEDRSALAGAIAVDETAGMAMFAGSRSRYITPASDNHGFAAWVAAHVAELWALGPGTHFGEWWGAGVQRRYGLAEKRFSLFNVSRWTDPATRPTCCHVVPTLAELPRFDTAEIDRVLETLAACGSHAAPGFMQPEGIVVCHVPSQMLFKKTIERDEEPKTAHARDVAQR